MIFQFALYHESIDLYLCVFFFFSFNRSKLCPLSGSVRWNSDDKHIRCSYSGRCRACIMFLMGQLEEHLEPDAECSHEPDTASIWWWIEEREKLILHLLTTLFSSLIYLHALTLRLYSDDMARLKAFAFVRCRIVCTNITKWHRCCHQCMK